MFLERHQISLVKATSVLVACGLLIIAGCCPVITSFNPEKGNVGDEVTIEGSRFESAPAANTVKFSGVTVPTTDITFASTAKIKAKVPTDASTGLISVTNRYCTGNSEKNFVVPTSAKWTFMVYLDADNNLESAGIDDFLEMASVGSTAGVNIVVQMDRISGYDASYGNWTGTRRFLIQKNDTPSVTPLQDLGEQNMGNPNVLQDFVEWTITNYPAEHYALAIWNHGGGWRILQERLIERASSIRSRGELDTSIAKAVAWDDTDGDVLYMKEVQEALEAAKQKIEERAGTTVKLDVVGFDACLMGMVEVAYAMRNVANYVVGSEETEPGDGWPYDTFLNDLVVAPSTNPKDFAKLIVTKYGDAYTSGITQASVDLAKLSNLCIKIDNFTNKAKTEWSKLKVARANTLVYHPLGPSYWGIDLWDFADRAYNQVTSMDIKTTALELKNAIDEFVINEHHSADMAGSHGIAIYFPETQTVFNNDPDHTGYEQSNTFMPVDFVTYHNWDNWLKDYYSNIP
jgi:hypothetical protein